MQFRKFGPTSRDVPIVGQGTWEIDESRRDLAIAALRRGLEEGMTHIDTAEMYGDAELLIAEAISGRRDEVFLVSKVLPQNATTDGVVAACERSLSRLRTDRLDCYLLHWRGRIPLSEPFRDSSSWFAQARSSPGASATSTFPISMRRLISPVRARSPATRSSTISRNGRSSMKSSRGANVTIRRSSPTARSATGAFPTSVRREEACSPRSPRPTMRRRAKSRSPSSLARHSRSPRRRPRNMPPRTQVPAISSCHKRSWPGSTPPSLADRSQACYRQFSS